MKITLKKLASILEAEAHGDADITGFATDSRAVKPGELFLAIRGARVDGHDCVPEALERGAAGTLAERPVPGPFALVPDLVEALARMGRHFRDGFDGPVVGITGSAGKTSTKELLAAALSPLGPVLKTEGNRNTEYTAPLLFADLAPEHRAVVVEMSMRGLGQIAHLAQMAQPTLGIVTNIGLSHVGVVNSVQEIAQAKGELLEALPSDGLAILPLEDNFFETLRDRSAARVRTFGFDEAADCRLDTADLDPDRPGCLRISGSLDGARFEARLPILGRHMALNAGAALLAATAAGVPLAEAAAALEHAEIPPLRMQLRQFGEITVLLDTYNASPDSYRAALQTLSELPCSGRRIAVVGEMRELGIASCAAHRALGRSLRGFRVDHAVFYGPETLACSEEWNDSEHSIHAESLDEIRAFLRTLEPGDAVLLKGSRALELEKALEGWSE